jgi:nucleoside-diphosphate-sugar epimerase
MKTSDKTALVLGATGGIGGEIARQLRDAGWKVRALKRGTPGEEKGIEWVVGDAMDGASVMRAAEGASVIVHAVNPPGYHNWPKVVLPMLDNTIAAARSVGARVVLPGTIYNYGPDAFPVLREDSPQNPLTRKGAIRVEMERRLREYGKTLIVRAGDFFGPKAGSSWFSQGLVKDGKVYNPGRVGVGHLWSYLPDVARTVVELLDKPLEPFATFHVAGHWDADGTQMAKAAARALGTDKVSAFPWWLMTLLAPFNTTLREMREMRYLWKEPLKMDNAKLRAVLGHEPHTPLDEAVKASLRGLGLKAV